MPANYLLASRIETYFSKDESTKELRIKLVSALKNKKISENPPGQSLLDLATEIAERMNGLCGYCAEICKNPDHPKLMENYSLFFYSHSWDSEVNVLGTNGSGVVYLDPVGVQPEKFDDPTIKPAEYHVNSKFVASISALLRKEKASALMLKGGEPSFYAPAIFNSVKFLKDNNLFPIPQNLLSARADILSNYQTDQSFLFYQNSINVPISIFSPLLANSLIIETLSTIIDLWNVQIDYFSDQCIYEIYKTENYLDRFQANLEKLSAISHDVIIRHHVHPGHLECCTIPALDFLTSKFPQLPIKIDLRYIMNKKQREEIKQMILNSYGNHVNLSSSYVTEWLLNT